MSRNPFAPEGPNPSQLPDTWGAPLVATAPPPPQALPASPLRAHIADLPKANFQPRKRPDTRLRGPVLFVRNLMDLKAPLEKAADELGIPRDMLVRYLLEQGLVAHQNGAAPLTPSLHQRLTLYPDEPGGKRKKKGGATKGVGFRGLPEDLRQALDETAQALSVPLWQVVRRLLEEGLTAWREGQLSIPVQKVQMETKTLYPEEAA